MKKLLLLSITLMPLTVIGYDDYTFGTDTPEIQFVNAAKSYAIGIEYDKDKRSELLRPLSRSGSVQLPTQITDDGKFKSVITLTAYSAMPDQRNNKVLDTKKYEITFDRQFGTPIRTESPAILINYSKGFFGNAGFDLKGSALVNDFSAREITGDELENEGQHIKPAFFNKTY